MEINRYFNINSNMFFIIGHIQNLLRLLTWSVTELFTTRAVTSAVRCWQWLLAAKPEIHLNFINQMVAAWIQSQEIKLGKRKRQYQKINYLQ